MFEIKPKLTHYGDIIPSDQIKTQLLLVNPLRGENPLLRIRQYNVHHLIEPLQNADHDSTIVCNNFNFFSKKKLKNNEMQVQTFVAHQRIQK